MLYRILKQLLDDCVGATHAAQRSKWPCEPPLTPLEDSLRAWLGRMRISSAWIRGLFSMLNRTSGRRRENRYRFRPQLETLTSRILPAVDVWTGANYLIDIDWSDGGNWSLGRAPMATDSAFFTSHTNDPEVIDPFSVIDQNYTI